MASPTVLPGQDLLASLLGVPAWTAMSLLNSWTNAGGSETTAQYRFWALLNEVEVIGNINHASISGASTIASPPFTPATNQRRALAGLTATNVYASATTGPHLLFTTAGSLQVVDMPAGTTSVFFHAWLSLDA